MPNMSYCRFENTAADLRDCADNIDGQLSPAEHAARKRLMRHCATVLRSAGVSITEDELRDALQECDNWN